VAEALLPALAGDPGEGVDRLLGEAELGAALGAAPRPDDPFLIWPTADQLGWHLERERFYSEALARARPRAWGAAIGRSVALFTAEPKHRQLVVQLLAIERAEDGPPLYRAARRVARQAELTEVRVWGEGSHPSAELPMLLPLAPGVAVDGWRTVPHAIWM